VPRNQPRLLALAFGLSASIAVAQPDASITGTVVDSSGVPVAEATVRLEAAGATADVFRTEADGRFSFNGRFADPIRIYVTAAGFVPATENLPAGATRPTTVMVSSWGPDRNDAPIGGENWEIREVPARRDLTIALRPAAVYEAVNVTASRTEAPSSHPPTTVNVIPEAELSAIAAGSVSDALQVVPGVALFRRTPMRVASLPSPGLVLRGLGGTTASRSLALADGVPLNDPMGGWIHWNRIPRAAVERVEVQRGNGGDLYGPGALAGITQVVTARPERPAARALLEAGNMGSSRVSAFGGGGASGWSYSAGGEWFETGGYIPVATTQAPGLAPRGPIDSRVGSGHRTVLATAAYQAGAWRFHGRGGASVEDRSNGTPAARSATASRHASAGAAGTVRGGVVSLHGFGASQGLDQAFTTVDASRAEEALASVQRVPAKAVGAGGQWLHPLGPHTMMVGAEARFAEGRVMEARFDAQGLPLPPTRAGGTEHLGAVFVQATLQAAHRLTIVTGLRGERWRADSRATGDTRGRGSLGARAAFAYRAGDGGITVRGAVYRADRPPSLDERYRGFSVGDVQTSPSDALVPERLTGAEGGLVVGARGASARVTAFWNRLDHAITEVTVSTGPPLTARERVNVGGLRTVGLEVEGHLRLSQSLTVTLAGSSLDASFTGGTNLRGNRVPHGPRHGATVGVRYGAGRWTASAQVRLVGSQFEDDLNQHLLRRASIADLFLGRSLLRQLQGFLAVENLFDSEYDAGRTPHLTVGLPRAVRGGVRIALP
jgi:outer membrane receptor protein involved in Fe transport